MLHNFEMAAHSPGTAQFLYNLFGGGAIAKQQAKETIDFCIAKMKRDIEDNHYLSQEQKEKEIAVRESWFKALKLSMGLTWPKATIETDEERTYFLIDIPCHPEFLEETLLVDTNVTKDGVKGGVKEQDVTNNVTNNVTKELTKRQYVILGMIAEDSFVTIPEMSLKTGVATRTIKRDIENLQSRGILIRKGGRRNGEWIVSRQWWRSKRQHLGDFDNIKQIGVKEKNVTKDVT